MKRNMLRLVLWLLVLLSLVPAVMIVYQRISVERSNRTVMLIIDTMALEEQAKLVGMSVPELANRYRKLGVNGVALFEDTVARLAMHGELALLTGREAHALASSLTISAEDLANIHPKGTLLKPASPELLDPLLTKYDLNPVPVTLADETWLAFEKDVRYFPAGLSAHTLDPWTQADWDIAYRPNNHDKQTQVGHDFPAEARYLIYQNAEVAGYPTHLKQTIAASEPYITAVIEGTAQKGMSRLAKEVDVTRLFSISQRWLNTLTPKVLVDKYLLAANERGARMLYLRPYTDPERGDVLERSETFIRRLSETLESEGYHIGPIALLHYPDPEARLQALCLLGVIAGLGLLMTLYPSGWGVIVALGVLGLGLVAGNGLNEDAFALMTALTFAVLGYGMVTLRFMTLPLATLISLIGALLMMAIGTSTAGMLALDPFAGVAATLIVPAGLFALHYALRYKRPVDWVVGLWYYRIRIGDVVVCVLILAVLALIFMRRGNTPLIGASELELMLRQFFSEYFARPRFKEIVGHALAVLALTNPAWLGWVRGCLLTAGVVAQGTILNSFSHYHTPVLVSLERTLIALVLGVLLGFALTLLTRLLMPPIRRWFRSAEPNSRLMSS